MQCLSQLKQLATAYALWASDRDQKYPMEVPVERGGIKGSPNEHNILTNYLIASREINDPKVLTCPMDKKRKAAESWSALTDKNLSYFLNIGATWGSNGVVTEVLLGDRGITFNGSTVRGYFETTNTNGFGWTNWVHTNGGDVALEDTSVHSVNDVQLNEFMEQSPPGSIKLLSP